MDDDRPPSPVDSAIDGIFAILLQIAEEFEAVNTCIDQLRAENAETESTLGNASWWYWLSLLWAGGVMLLVGIALLVRWLKEFTAAEGAVSALLSHALAQPLQYGGVLIALALVFVVLGWIGFRKA